MKPTLAQLVEQFLYTHPVQHHKKELLALIREAEEGYLRRIAELENDAQLPPPNPHISQEWLDEQKLQEPTVEEINRSLGNFEGIELEDPPGYVDQD